MANLPPLQELRELRRELDFADADIRFATACYQLYRPAALDSALLRRLGKSFATQGFHVVREALYRETVLALMRIWDNTNKGNFRLRSFLQRIARPDVIAAIAERRAAAGRSLGPLAAVGTAETAHDAAIQAALRKMAERHATKARLDARREVAALVRLSGRILDGDRSDIRKALERLRHRILAHTEVRPALATAPAAKIVRGAKYGDERRLLLWTQNIVQRLNLLVDDLNTDPKGVRRTYRKAATYFWLPVRGERP